MLEFVLGYTAGKQGAGRAASLARSAAVGDATIHTNRVEDLNERLDSLARILRATWAILEEQGISTELLVAKLAELDRLDGETGGLRGRVPVDCPSCRSKVAPGLSRCQFCGTDVVRDDEGPLGRI